ncbi:hypothetical protein [Streptomyces sp. NPDC048350]|uniref:hypothetical protein n=1 Tax=Streptomyces sp. NPDC048350 TaxID=3365538 RepID=UPI003721BBA0
MAAPTPPPPNPNAPNAPSTPQQSGSLWYAPWINEADYKSTKEAAFGWTSTVTAVKADITLIKAEISGLAVFSLGASIFKFDYTWFKMDEKGVTINGRQRYGWPWADQAKHFNVKAEQQNRRLVAEQKDIKEQLRRLTAAQDRATDRRDELARAGTTRDDARRRYRTEGTAASLEAFLEAEKNYQKAKKAADKAEKELERAGRKAKKLSDSAAQRFADAKRFLAAEDAAKKQWANDGTKVVTDDLNRLRTALGEAAIQA